MKKGTKIVWLGIDTLIPYEHNAKEHTPTQIENLKKSLSEYGWQNPCLITKDNVLITGHGRVMAAKELSMSEVPCIYADDLTEKQIKEYRHLDNLLSEGGYIESELKYELQTVDLSGYDFSEIDVEIQGVNVPEDNEPLEVIEDEIPEKAETRCKTGDLWQLGEHRLICGDSTDKATFDRLMDGQKADITITSPPYNADHMDVRYSADRGGGVQKDTQKKYLADNDKRSDDEYFDFITQNIDLLLEYSSETFYNIGIIAGSKRTVARILNHYADNFKDLIYWVKDNPAPIIVESVISSATELIICLGKNGSRSFNHFNDRLFHGVISGCSASATNQYADIHKATYPIYLPSEIIKRFTTDSGTVLDCFGGTGTTMIACEQLNRKCFMCELDEHYCDVIIQRWENLTGNKAVLINE